MKKRIVAGLLVVTMMCSLTACGKTKRSGQFEIDKEKQVTTFCDYEGIELTSTGNYEYTQEDIDYIYNNVLASFASFEEVTNRTIVEDGDIVKCTYTGYLNDEKFEGGSTIAEDGTVTYVMLDVTNNMDAEYGTTYIPGFTDCLIGAEVGTTVSGDVTFPEDYGNEELNGQLTRFDFEVVGIFTKVEYTKDTVTDDFIADNLYQYYQVSTVEEFEEYIDSYLMNNMEYYRYEEGIELTKEYMLENCEVEIPEDYLTARLNEYEAAFISDYCGTEKLEDYIPANFDGKTVEDIRAEWKESLIEQIKVEFIFGLVAQKEEIDIEDEDFDEYIQEIMNQDTELFPTAEALYEYYGAGNAEEGEAYLREQCRVNRAITWVFEHANVTNEPVEE